MKEVNQKKKKGKEESFVLKDVPYLGIVSDALHVLLLHLFFIANSDYFSKEGHHLHDNRVLCIQLHSKRCCNYTIHQLMGFLFGLEHVGKT